MKPAMTRQEILQKARELPRDLKAEASNVWQITADAYTARIARLPRSKRKSSFEVHHALERAREAFLKGLVEGKPVLDCAIAANLLLK